MDPVNQFVAELDQFLKSKGYSIVSSEDLDLRDANSRIVGYWPSRIDTESFVGIK